MWIIIVVAVIVAIVLLKKKKDKDRVTSGEFDEDIKTLEKYYDVARNCLEDLGGGVIGISTYWFELEGKMSSSSGFLSVCLENGNNDSLAKSIGMDVSVIEGKKYYQFAVRKKFSITQKREILRQLAQRLASNYSKDAIQFDESIPAIFALVDSKDFIEIVQRNRT